MYIFELSKLRRESTRLRFCKNKATICISTPSTKDYPHLWQMYPKGGGAVIAPRHTLHSLGVVK